MFVPVLLSVTLVVTLVTSVGGQSTCGTASFPPPTIIIGRADRALEAGFTVLVTEKGRINCYGRIEGWEFWADAACDTIRFQVWRPQNAGQYLLVGENQVTACNTNAVNTIPVADVDSLSVRPDDVIGWTQVSNNGMLVSDSGLPGSTAYGEVLINNGGCTGTAVGATCAISTQFRRDYSLRAVVTNDDQPTFMNLPTAPDPIRTETVSEDSPVGTSVYTAQASPRLTWGNSIPQDVRYRISSAALPNTNCFLMFNMDNNTGLLTYTGDTTTNKDWFGGNRLCRLRISAETDTRWVPDRELHVTVSAANHPHTLDLSTLPAIRNLDTTVSLNTQVHQFNVFDRWDNVNPFGLRPNKNFRIVEAQPDATIFDIRRRALNQGEVECNRDLTFWTGPTKYFLNITAADDLYVDGPLTLQVDITNLRTPHHLITPPASVTLLETETGPINNLSQITGNFDNNLTPRIYTLRQYPQNEGPWFSIDAGLERVRLNAAASFDYKRTKKYEVEITVTDNQIGYTDAANLTVEITRVNKPPEFTVTGPVTATMPEEMAIHSPVPGLNLTVYDRDIEFGDTFSLRILPGGTNSQFFYTKVGSTQLFVNQRMDVDPNNEKIRATFNVQVRDQAGTSKNPEGTVSVSIDVTDINDNAPIFTQSSFSGSIVENTNGTHVVGTFTATDRDWGQNAAIFYTIQNNATGARGDYYFQVDPTTGELKVKHPIDREEHQEIIFRLVATDGGTPPLSGYMSVYLSVEDLNDNRPMFTKDLYNTEVPSYVSTHTTVTTIVAVDPDIDSRVTYFLLVPNSNFYLSAMDGHVTTTRGLSSGTTHYLYCYARDHGVNPGELFSDPSVVRIDAFEAGDHLIDVTLNILLKDFTVTMETEFVDRLRTLLHPWIIKILRKQARNSQTVVTLYSLEDNVTDSFDNRFMIKHFVHRDSLLATMRKDIHGTPSDPLLGPDFAKFRPVHVGPTYPNWIIETVGGIATLTVILVVATALLIGGAVLAMKMLQVGPFKPKIAPTTVRKVVPADEFKLNYATEPKKVTPPVVMRPAASSVLPSRIGNRPRPPPPTFEA